MTALVEELAAKARELPMDDREELIARISQSVDEEVDAAWLKEAERRADELLTGKVKAISWEEVREQLRQKFAWMS